MDLTDVDTTALKAELARRERAAQALLKRRETLARRLAELEAELATLDQQGGEAAALPAAPPSRRGAPGRKRARNAVSLADALAQAMEVRAVVTPKEAADLVRENGYRSTAKNFGMMVSNALSRDKRFKRVARGRYERVG